ncbi:MAG: hypothetical protein NBV63_01450 [Candidatus Pacebacteria bacterium]|nr:hypothetical protein [Candidatus Paceibacterota bacterium]
MKVLRNKLGFVVLGAFALGFVALLFTLTPTRTPDLSQYPSLSDATLEGRTIVDFGENSDGTVTYTYLEKPVPETLAEREVPELRTENSYTVLEKVVDETGKEEYTLTSTFFAQPAFAQDVDGSWRYLEYATTTQEAFRNRSQTLFERIAESLVRTAYADSVSPFSGAGDGDVYNQDIQDTGGFGVPSCDWGTVRSASDGVSVDSTGLGFSVFTQAQYEYTPFNSGTCEYTIVRGFVPFNTSSIPDGATISAASLSVYIYLKVDSDNDGLDYITVSTSTQATHTTLDLADYDAFGSEVIDSGERKDITAITISAYTVFNLNANGTTAIKKSGQASSCSATTGITCLAMREGHDVANSPHDANTFVENTGVYMYSSERTGTSEDPYLTVTYTVPAAAVSSGLSLPSGGININSGGLQIF